MHSIDPNAFLAQLTPKLLDYVEGQADTSRPTVRFADPLQIAQAFEAVGCPLPVGSEAVGANELLKACDQIMDYSVRTSSPLFNNQVPYLAFNSTRARARAHTHTHK